MPEVEISSAFPSRPRAATREHLAGSPILTIRLDPEGLVAHSHDLVLSHQVGTLGAIHLAVALSLEAWAGGDEVVFVTRDAGQAAAARALGLGVL